MADDNRLLAFFPQEIIDLQEELKYHPSLVEKLERISHNEFEIKVAQVATHLNIVMDGMYEPGDLVRLCGLMTEKLRQQREVNPGRDNILIIESSSKN